MTFRYGVTFENRTGAPLTIRGAVEAGSTQAGARLSVRDAMRRAPGRRWSSLVLLLERSEKAEPAELQEPMVDVIDQVIGVAETSR
jgi:hypothetical protein